MAGVGSLDGPGLHAHGDNDNTLWMMANPDWATLSIWRGGDPVKALAVADKTLDWWRSHLKDMWNVVAVGGGLEYGVEGQPMANSHYGYHMVMWHIPFALSGQHWDAPSQALTFKPKLPAPVCSQAILQLLVISEARLTRWDVMTVLAASDDPGDGSAARCGRRWQW